jgi:hypothetical protein
MGLLRRSRVRERAKAVGQAVRFGDHFVKRIECIDDRDRAERLFGHDARALRRIGDNGGCEEIAPPTDALATHAQRTAARQRILDEALHRAQTPLIGERSHRHAVGEAVADRHLRHRRNEHLDEWFIHLARDKKARRRRAYLTRVAQLERAELRCGRLDIGVFADQHGTVAAELHRRFLHVTAGQFREMLSHRRRASE